MDVAYDHVQEEALPEHKDTLEGSETQDASSADLRSELSQTYQAFSQSAWGTRLGGFWASARKQGETYYQTAQQELSEASTAASKGVNDLITNTGALTIASLESGKTPPPKPLSDSTTDPTSATSTTDPSSSSTTTTKNPAVPESLTADIAKEARSLFTTFSTNFSTSARARLKQVKAAEDAADQALLSFGSNIRDYLRDAVKVTGPEDGSGQSEVLFESRDIEGRRVVHATRFDAQLHVIHSNLTSFTQDPDSKDSEEWTKWKNSFNIDGKTDAIAADLQEFPELRKAMERLVPEKVEYKDFWTRYYFLRHVIETEERKRRELLSAAPADEEVGWGDDDDDDEETEEKVKTPSNGQSGQKEKGSADGQATPTKAGANEKGSSADLLKPGEGRRSNEHSVADSDMSYDIVSGATSRAPGSPKDEKVDSKKPKAVAEESDDDWE